MANCEACRKPKVFRGNAKAWEIFHLCLGRDAMGFSCINYDAVRFVFDLYEFDPSERIACYRKLVLCERALRKHQEATASVRRNES